MTLCHIALGAIDGYQIEGPGISTWDIAAASLIITEAGGVVIDRVTGNYFYLDEAEVSRHFIIF